MGSGEGAAERLGEAGAEAAACAGELNGGHERKVLIVLTDGLAGDQQEIVRGAYAAVGAGVPLVGGCAGDGLDVVAEGIESTTQRNQLIDLGCEMGQGLHLSPPLPVEEADALLLGAGLLPPPREPGSEDVAHEHEGDTAREDAPQ